MPTLDDDVPEREPMINRAQRVRLLRNGEDRARVLCREGPPRVLILADPREPGDTG